MAAGNGATVWWGVLGPLVVGRDGTEVPIRRAKHRELICRLLLAPGASVTNDRLVEDLWAGAPPATARKAVQVYVSEVRRLLGDQRHLLARDPAGYRLDVDPGETDVGRFATRSADGARALANHEPERATQHLREALELWRGAAFADVAGSGWASAEISRLDELRLATLERRLDADLVIGRHVEAAAELGELVTLHPFREGLWALGILAAYRCDRPADALELFRRARTTLGEELGADPGPALVELEQRVLRQDPSLGDARPLHQLLGVEPSTPAAPVRSDEVERRWVWVLTIRGSASGTATDLGDLIASLVDAHGGTVIAEDQHEVVTAFGAPSAFGDEADRVAATLHALPNVVGLQVAGCGLSAGEVTSGVAGLPGYRHYRVDGVPVDHARWLAAAAKAGAVLADGHAVAALPAGLVAHTVGTVHDLPAWRISRGGSRGGTTPFVGREAELGLLDALWDVVRNRRRPHLACLIGEAGIGKSRLVDQWCRRLGADTEVATGAFRPHRSAPYSAVTEVVRRTVGVDDLRAPRVSTWLEDHEIADPALVAEGLRALEGHGDTVVDSQRVLFDAVRQVLVAQARRSPTVVVIDDLHWAPPTAVELLAWVRANATEAPLLVIVTARPELEERAPGWFGRGGNSTVLHVERLDDDASTHLAIALAGEPADADTVRRLSGTAGGNPLFQEELAAWARGGGAGPLPGGVRATIAARLDTLDRRTRAALQSLAVIGAVVDEAALEAVSPVPTSRATLDDLTDRDLLRRTADGYVFKHALVAEVAYASLADGSREQLHARLAAHLEGEHGGELTPAVLAHHWTRAGVRERAVDHLVAAAEQAARGWAQDEAIEMFDEALELLPEGDVGRRRAILARRGRSVLKWVHAASDAPSGGQA